MQLELQPELGVPIPPDLPYVDLRERADAACRAMELLEEHGFEAPEATLTDKEVAAQLASAYAANPVVTSQKANNLNASSLTPACLQHVRSYLDEFGQAVVTHAVEVRHLVTNRLLEESQNPDPRIRIRALELLGKISDVGLFTDKQEITITHQTTDELKERLRGKLQKLVRRQATTVGMQDNVIDVDAELGLERKNPTLTAPESSLNDEIHTKPAKTADIFEPEADIEEKAPWDD